MSVRLCAAAACLALAACASSGSRDSYAADLGRARLAIEGGDLASAERDLGALFLDGAPGAREDQIFWAAWLLAQAHLELALVPAGQGGMGAGVARSAHIQAALYYSRLARAAQHAAPDRAPSELDYAGTRDQAALGLDLLELALVSRLGFEERVALMVDANATLERPSGVTQLTEQAELDARQTAWVLLALQGYWARRDPLRAFDLTVRALAAADADPGVLEPDEVRALEAWIEQGAGVTFRCPECRQAAVPQLRACPNDQTPLGSFYPDAGS